MKSFVMLSSEATELLKGLSFLIKDDKILPCTLLSADSPYYLHIEVTSEDNPEIGGTLLIPHSAVVFIGTNTADKKLGFT